MDNKTLVLSACECTKQLGDKVFIALKANGGWERWYQMELVRYLSLKTKYFFTDAEYELYEKSGTVDIMIRDWHGNKESVYYIELKCMGMNVLNDKNDINDGRVTSFINGVVDDWKKQTNRRADRKFSLVMIPVTIPITENNKSWWTLRTLLEMAKNYSIESGYALCVYYNNSWMYICSFELINKSI